MKLGLGLGVNSITSQKTSAAFTGILDEFTGAAAAYSVRRLSSTYTGDAMKVRRSSDDTIQDIGFNSSGNLDTSALLSFVGGGDGHVVRWYSQSGAVDTYTSDFSSGVDSFSATNNNSVTRVASVTDDHGTTVNNVLKLNCDNTNNDEHVARKNNPLPTTGSIANLTLKCSFKMLVPTSNTTLTRAAISNGSQSTSGIVEGGKVTEKGRWVQFTDVAWTQVSSQPRIIFMGLNSSDVATFSATADDHFFIADIVLTQTRDSYNDTAAEQPKIVDSGALVTVNSNAGIDFDGSDDFFAGAAKTTIANTAIFCVIKSDSNTQDSVFIQNAVDGSNLVSLGLGAAGTESKLGSRLKVGGSNIDSAGGGFTATTQTLVSFFADNSACQLFIDGTEETVSVASRSSGTNTAIGAKGDGNNPFNGKIQEVIFYDSDESGKRTDIEANINNYF